MALVGYLFALILVILAIAVLTARKVDVDIFNEPETIHQKRKLDNKRCTNN